MAERLKVIYQDGREPHVVKVTPRAKIEAERHFKGVSYDVQVEGSYWIAWWLSKKAEKTASDFNKWIDEEIDEVERVLEDDEDEGPTEPTVTSVESSD